MQREMTETATASLVTRSASNGQMESRESAKVVRVETLSLRVGERRLPDYLPSTKKLGLLSRQPPSKYTRLRPIWRVRRPAT